MKAMEDAKVSGLEEFYQLLFDPQTPHHQLAEAAETHRHQYTALSLLRHIQRVSFGQPYFPTDDRRAIHKNIGHLNLDGEISRNNLIGIKGWTISNATNCLIENLEVALPPTRSNTQLISKFKELRRNARVTDWLVGQENPLQHPLYTQLLEMNIKTAQQLQSGEFTLLPGYWRTEDIQDRSQDASWHGIYYMLQKNANNTYRFTVFNTGYGGHHHESNQFCDDDPRDFQTEIHNGRRKLEDFMFNPRFCVDQIQAEYIEHSLIKKLLDWSLGLETCKSATFYRAISNFGTKITLGEKDFLPQIDGTCTWRGLMSLFHYLADDNTRNTIEYRFRVNALVRDAKQLQTLKLTKRDKRLLTLATRTLRQSRAELTQQGSRSTTLLPKRTYLELQALEDTLGLPREAQENRTKRMRLE